MAIFWTFGALLLLVVLLLLVKLVRSMTFGTSFPAGATGKTRLAVMDATAVDSHRRLVLVRRDDIEHLLLIRGADGRRRRARHPPRQQRRAAQPAEQPRETCLSRRPLSPAGPDPASASAVEPPRAPCPQFRRASAAAVLARPSRRPARTAAGAVAPAAGGRPAPASERVSPAERMAPSMPQAAPLTVAPYAPAAPAPEELDDELLKELEVSLEETPRGHPGEGRRFARRRDDEAARRTVDAAPLGRAAVKSHRFENGGRQAR